MRYCLALSWLRLCNDGMKGVRLASTWPLPCFAHFSLTHRLPFFAHFAPAP